MDIYEKLRTDYYKTKLPYAPRSKDLKVWEAHMADSRRLNEEFKRDALEEVGLTDHPKAEKAWSFAWEEGRSAGRSEVFGYLDRIAEVLKD